MTESPVCLADPHARFPAKPPPEGPREVVVLGSTGSIGTQAIDVVLRNPHLFRVTGLSAAGERLDRLAGRGPWPSAHTPPPG